MLSKKMAVSLTSLIIICALAFAGPAAMAATFGVALNESMDISSAAGLQLERPSDNKLKVKVMFDQAVVLVAANIAVSGFDMKGIYEPAVKREGDLPTDASDEIELTIAVTGDTARVSLMIAKDPTATTLKGIDSADAFNDDVSAVFMADVGVLDAGTDLSPAVYGIRRADNSAAPLTGGAVNVIITLSEEPQAFTAAHISATNATASAPVKLTPVAQNRVGLDQFARAIDEAVPMALTVAQIRDGILKDDAVTITGTEASADTELTAGHYTDGQYIFKGIDYYLSAHANAKDKIPGDYLAAVIALKKTLESTDLVSAGTPAPDTPNIEVTYHYLDKDGKLQTAMLEWGDDAAPPDNVRMMPIVNDVIAPPTTQGTIDLTDDDSDENIRIPAASFDRSKKKEDYKHPNPADFTDPALYDFAVYQYNALTGNAGYSGTGGAVAATGGADDQRAAYTAEKAIYDKYIALQNLIIEDDMEAVTKGQENLVTKASAGDTSVIAQNVLPPTGRDGMLHPYSVTITPTYKTAADIIVRVNKWQTMGSPDAMIYHPPVLETGYTEGFNSLTIGVSASAVVKPPVTQQGVVEITLPAALGAITIPAASPGFLIFAANAEGSGIALPGGTIGANGLTTAPTTSRTPVEQVYNIIDLSRLSATYPTMVDPLPNLQNFLSNGGTIHLRGPVGLVISEVMWGVDTSLDPHNNSQWIEVKNVTGAPLVAAAGTLGLVFTGPNETLPVGTTPVDSVGTYTATGGFWNIVTTGAQGGRTGTSEKAAGVAAVVPTQELISMQRRFSDTAQTMPEPGTLATSWGASPSPALNFDRSAIGQRTGTPGAQPLTPLSPTPPKVTPKVPTVPVAKASDIMITEVMVDTSDDRFPQWIELTHVGTGKVSLNGWGMVVDNALDADVLGGGNAITVGLSGTLDVSKDTRNAGAGQSLLVVAWASKRHSAKIRADRVLDLGPKLKQSGRYQLLSYNGFRITLVPPQTGAIANFGDIVGNLGEDWVLPMLEGPKRSSLIRREMSNAGMTIMGTDANGWTLASSTQLIKGPETFYGNDEDAGTPGYDAGGPLPVELSHFRPARDKATGQVVITWATQSELNNAGFFIKRSNQRNGDFKVINATMVPGAGTTSEKQFYTYTDTTAQPNVVYYYQIEDVSLDGNRQLLTRGIRLKGHIGAAGKATVIWGDLKTSHE